MNIYIIAQAAPGGGDIFTMLLPFGLIFVVFYFIIWRPQAKQREKHQKVPAALTIEKLTNKQQPQGTNTKRIGIIVIIATIYILSLYQSPSTQSVEQNSINKLRGDEELPVPVKEPVVPEEKKTSKTTDTNKTIIGTWYDQRPHLNTKLVFFSKNGKTFVDMKYEDGSRALNELRSSNVSSGRRLEADNDHGEYWLLKGGNLEIYDRDGLILRYTNGN